MSLTEEEKIALIEDYKNGNEKAFEILLSKEKRLIYYTINKMRIPNRIDEEELVSVGYEAFLNAVHKFRRSENVLFSTYCYFAIRNKIIVYINREMKYSQNNLTYVQEKDLREDGFYEDLEKRELLTFIEKLSPHYREIVTLRLKNFFFSDIGKRFNRSHEWARLEFNAGVNQLRNLYEFSENTNGHKSTRKSI